MPRSWMLRRLSWRFRKTFPVENNYTGTTADPSTTLLRSSGRDDKGGRLRFGRLATWMDRVTNDYFAKTAGPSTALRYGRDDKGRAVTFRKIGDLDSQGYERLLCER
jgi:hypothetical protein